MGTQLMTIAEDLSGVVTGITGAFTTADLLAIVGVVIGAVAGYVVLWFGVRKLISAAKAGIFRGKLKF